MKTLIALVILCLVAACADSSGSSGGPTLVVVDLANFPETGEAVPNGAVLTDQWRTIGLDISAEPEDVDAIKHDFGTDTPHLFFDPDEVGVAAVFTFVDPTTGDPTEAIAFNLAAFFNPGESAQLIGFDATGTEVSRDDVTTEEVGAEDRTVRMRITGRFATVKWVTQGNPGIAANEVSFVLSD